MTPESLARSSGISVAKPDSSVLLRSLMIPRTCHNPADSVLDTGPCTRCTTAEISSKFPRKVPRNFLKTSSRASTRARPDAGPEPETETETARTETANRQANRQSEPHAHAIVLDPYFGKVAFIPDLGMVRRARPTEEWRRGSDGMTIDNPRGN